MRSETPDEARERRDREEISDIAQGRVRKDPGGERVDVARRQRATREEALDRPASESEETKRKKASERPHWDVPWRGPQ